MWKQNCVLIHARCFCGTYSSQIAGGSTMWLSQSKTEMSLVTRLLLIRRSSRRA